MSSGDSANRGDKRPSPSSTRSASGLVDVRFRPGQKWQQRLNATRPRLRKTHEAATIAAIGADEVGGLSGSAHESFGP